jgi:putative endonuclease
MTQQVGKESAVSKSYYIYILTNKWNRVLYTGITRDLVKRIYQHREEQTGGFTTRYNLKKLVYFEIYSNPREAIEREKQIKEGSRKKKIRLVEEMNPEWKDLYPEIASLR